MEDAWDWVEEELKKIQTDVPQDPEMMQVVDAISVADFWKRRYDEELMLWERRIEQKEEEKRNLQTKAVAHESSIKELDWKLRELERRWEQEKLLLEDRIKSKEVEAELEKSKATWEIRLRSLEEENHHLKTHMDQLEGAPFMPSGTPSQHIAFPPAAPSRPSAVPPAGSMTSKELETIRQQLERQMKEREEQLQKGEEEVRKRLEQLQSEKDAVAKELSEKEALLHQEKDQWMKADKDISGASSQMKQQLTNLKERETEHFVILEDLARGFAHRVRNYLGIISGTVQLSVANYKMEPDLEEQLKVVDQNVQEMLKSIEDFLGLARIPEMYLQPLNFNQLFDTICQTMAPKFKMQNIVVTKQYEPSLPVFKGDPKLFEEGLQNLVQNSFEALPEGGQITITTAVDKKRGAIVLKVNDTGVGVADTHLKKIFQPYFSSKKNHKGLGLTSAKRIIDLHRGTLVLESVKGKGTTVVINLFLADEQ